MLKPPRWLLAVLGCAAAAPLRGSGTWESAGALYHLHRISRAALPALQLAWLGTDGRPLGSFEGLRRELAAQGRRLTFATNAGIYARGPTPCGLTISAGRQLVPLNLQPGEGNFYLMPNGVFFVDVAQGAGVMEAAEFARSGLQPRLATQSGPLLLRRGTIHPAFNATSTNRRQRSGVGVRTADGEVIFLVSDRTDRVKGRVTFHQLATAFLELGCADALFLDGDISELTVNPPEGLRFAPNTFAAMFYTVAGGE